MATSHILSTPAFDLGPSRNVSGRGVDASPAKRPGIPMETEPRPLANAPPLVRQRPGERVLKRAELDELTPVFGTAQPPKGLSGALRAAAYKTPEHLAKHWMLLLLADRVDVAEHRLSRAARYLPVALPLLLFGLASRSRSRARPMRVRRPAFG